MDNAKPENPEEAGAEESEESSRASPGTFAQQRVKEARTREAEWEQALKILREGRREPPTISAFLMKGTLGAGVISLAYFISLAFRDPDRFLEGVGILAHNAWQFAATALLWVVGLWAYSRLSPEKQQETKRVLLYSGLFLLSAALFYVLGFFDSDRRRLWGRGAFLFSLLTQVAGWLFIYRKWKRLGKVIDEGEAIYIWHRPLLYLAEGLLIYLTVGILLQAVAQVNVFGILSVLAGNPKAFALFCFPLVGYLLLRKLASVN